MSGSLEAVVLDNSGTVLTVGAIIVFVGLLIAATGATAIGGPVFLAGLFALLLGAWIGAMKGGI